MIFANPYFLLLLLPVIGAYLFFLLTERKAFGAMSFPSTPGAAPRETLRARMAVMLPALVRTAALCLAIIALARPQKVLRTELPPTEGVDIMMVVDTSLSMKALDFDPYNRLEAAQKAAREFIEKRKNDRIGIVVFGGNALLQCPLTLDYDSLLEFLDGVEIGMTDSDGTTIGDALAVAVNHLKDSAAKSKVIILLTDGRSNTGVITDPSLAAKAAATYGIKVYTVGTAGKGPAKVPIDDPIMGHTYAMQQEDLDEGALLEIARLTGGDFFRATNYSELQNIYSKIDSLEKTRFNNPITVNRKDYYGIFLGAAVILLLLEVLVLRTAFFRIP